MSERERSVPNELVKEIDKLISVVAQDETLTHILPLLQEARRAAENGPEFDAADIARVADLISSLSSVDQSETEIDRAKRYADGRGPSLFVRALLVELDRRAKEK